MISRRTLGDILWISLESPTQQEVRSVAGELNLDSAVADELLLPSAKPRLELHDGYLFTILHFPALRHTHSSTEQEIDFVVGNRFIITAQYDTIDPIHKFSKVFEVNAVLDKSVENQHAGFIFYFLLKKLYKSVEHEISSVNDALHDIEENIFEGREREMVAALSFAGRDLLNMRQVIEPHRDILQELELQAPRLFGSSFTPFVKHLSNTYFRVHSHIMRHIETLRELRETNNSLLTTKQNEIMKTLTIISFVTFPLTLIAAVFGMGTTGNPLDGTPYEFWIVISVMFVATLVMFLFFKRKGWI